LAAFDFAEQHVHHDAGTGEKLEGLGLFERPQGRHRSIEIEERRPVSFDWFST
jgi:hypothetical protein